MAVHSFRIISYVLFSALAVLLFSPAAADSQESSDQEILLQSPSPTDNGDLSLSAEHLTVWSETDGSRVMLFQGDFNARCSAATLTSRNAVIWLTQTSKARRASYHLRIYLEDQAKIVESSQATIQDKKLLARLEVSARIIIQAIERTDRPDRRNPLYLRAAQTLASSNASQLAPAEPLEESDITTPKQDSETAPARKTNLPGSEPPRVLRKGPVKISPGPVFIQGSFTTMRRGDELIRIFQADERGPVYVSQGATKGTLLLEIMADSAVVFQDAHPLDRHRQDEKSGTENSITASLTGVYLRGNVVLRQGDRTIRAKEVYYDFRNQQALITDGILRTIARQRNVPMYVHARQIRQLSQGKFLAHKVMLTSSDFATPDYYVGASKLLVTDITPRDEQGNKTGPQKLYARAENVTVIAGVLPLFWWPVMTGDLQRGETPIHKVVLGHSTKNGLSIKTEWWLLRLLGLEEPDDVNVILGVDYLQKRGPVLRYHLDYLRDNYEGYSEAFIINDHGEDRLSRTRKDLEPPREVRGRFLLRHRHYLPRDWEMQLEASYISDANFLEEFMEDEFDTDKDQEAVLYFKKQRDNWAFSLLGNTRLMNFITLTDHYPEARVAIIGEPIAGLATGFLDARGGLLQLRNNENFPLPKPMDSSDVFRGDVRAEIDLPLQLGLVKLLPYFSARGSAWDDSPTSGGQQRYFLTAGFRAGSQFWRVYDNVKSRLWDLHRLRHIIQPEIHAFWAETNHDHGTLGTGLWPFDQEVEGLRDFAAVSIALLQTFQTKRGPADRQRDVDWFKANLRATFFNRYSPLFGTQDFSDPAFPTNMTRLTPRGRWFDSRPENSFPRDNIQADFSLRLSDTTLLFTDLTYAMHGRSLDLFDFGLAVTRSPRLSYFLADRFNKALDMQVLTGGVTYKLNDKYTISANHQRDVEKGHSLATNVMLVRKFPRWYVSISANLDRTGDDAVFMFNIWPEGLPAIRLGTRVSGDFAAQ